MKKLITTFVTLFFVSFLLISCGNSMESDAKKLAELQCKSQNLIKNSSGDLTKVEEATKTAQEYSDMMQKMQSKYSSNSDQIKFNQALLKEMEKCK